MVKKHNGTKKVIDRSKGERNGHSGEEPDGGQKPREWMRVHLVDVLIATVIAGTGKTLGVLVGKARAEALHHGRGGEVL